MRKKSSYSEENFLSANSAKVSEFFRQNPRLPKKMKTVKSKYPIPTVRTVGQLSCGGKNSSSTTPFGFQNMSGGEPLRKVSQLDDPWTKLHRTFSNSQSPRNFPHPGEYPHNEPAVFCSVTKVKDEHQTEFHKPAVVTHNTSETGVQVSMFHCKECRRHIKYGKTFKLENSCTESDSENNQLASTGCTNCERKEGMINLSVDDNEIEDEEKSENEESLFQRRISPCNHVCTPCDCSPPKENSPTPRFDTLPKNGDETPQDSDNGVQGVKLSHTKGGKRIWLSNIKLMTVAIVVIPLILHLLQIETFSTTLSKFNFYLRNIMVQEETEENSVFSWIFDLIFGVQGLAKPLPFFLYLF